MRVAFITPNTDGSVLDLERPLVPMAPAMLAGFLSAYGHRDIRQYDFNGVIRDRWLQGSIDPSVFEDTPAVDRFLAGGEGCPVQEQARRILDALDVQAADLYALSCSLASSTSKGGEGMGPRPESSTPCSLA